MCAVLGGKKAYKERWLMNWRRWTAAVPFTNESVFGFWFGESFFACVTLFSPQAVLTLEVFLL